MDEGCMYCRDHICIIYNAELDEVYLDQVRSIRPIQTE